MSKERLVLGGGCFWCTEAVFLNVKGVNSVESAYTGGLRPNPTYESICTGVSGHAEVIDIEYDSELIKLENLLEIFFENCWCQRSYDSCCSINNNRSAPC